MPVITSIKPQKSNKRLNIYLDDKFAFGLDLQTYLKRGLKVEQVLTEEQIASIVKESEFQSTYDKILRFASMRPRSEKEFEIWLKKHKVHSSLHEELFNRLKHLEMMDDKKFALWWVEQRIQFKSKSKRIIEQELRMKGISQDVIEDVFAEEKVDEKEAAKKILMKKERLWKYLEGFEKRKKMFSFLMQKGFDAATIRDVLGSFEDDLDI